MPDSHDPTDVARLLNAGDMTLVDVRDHDEWAKAHVKDAVHLPLAELGQRAGELPRDGVLVFICRTGKRSEKAAEQVAEHGITAGNVTGGMDAWAEAGLPVEQEDAAA